MALNTETIHQIIFGFISKDLPNFELLKLYQCMHFRFCVNQRQIFGYNVGKNVCNGGVVCFFYERANRSITRGKRLQDKIALTD